jgi:hypothetical protein
MGLTHETPNFVGHILSFQRKHLRPSDPRNPPTHDPRPNSHEKSGASGFWRFVILVGFVGQVGQTLKKMSKN